jgi:hypothetical protein
MKEHILDKIKTADNKTLVYYREYGSYPLDVKTRVEVNPDKTTKRQENKNV